MAKNTTSLARLFPAVLLFSLSVATGGIVPNTAAAQSLCAARAQVIGMLQSRYGEERHGMGMANGNHILEIFTSEETGTWSITVTNTSGRTCLVASGRNFEAMASVPDGEAL